VLALSHYRGGELLPDSRQHRSRGRLTLSMHREKDVVAVHKKVVTLAFAGFHQIVEVFSAAESRPPILAHLGLGIEVLHDLAFLVFNILQDGLRVADQSQLCQSSEEGVKLHHTGQILRECLEESDLPGQIGHSA